jgi:hypothetical protein
VGFKSTYTSSNLGGNTPPLMFEEPEGPFSLLKKQKRPINQFFSPRIVFIYFVLKLFAWIGTDPDWIQIPRSLDREPKSAKYLDPDPDPEKLDPKH